MQEQGLVEAIGLSNFSPAQALQLSRDFPVSTVQNNFIDSLDSTFNRGIADLKKAGVKSQCYGVFGKGAFLSPLDKNRFSVNDFRRSKHCRAGDLEEQSRSLRQSIEPTAKNLSANTVLSYALARSNFDQFIIGQSSGDQLNQNLSFF
jgi:aryl-alcohol dehydrogenase-like predicted oxidoreductase